jgi:hypothetical protein
LADLKLLSHRKLILSIWVIFDLELSGIVDPPSEHFDMSKEGKKGNL